ncbi:MAG: cell surface protein, partial [Pirellulaceae bacterium]|nr:cell surface protein [Pirellulaceae bacterium]
ERRELLAAGLGVEEGPRLISVSANSGEQFDLDDNNLLPVAPTELTFRFGGALIDDATLAGIQFRRSGGDGSFNENNEIDVTPGFLGFEQDNGTNIIVARFAETLPDDQYVIDIAGFDDTGAGIVGLRDIDGNLICPPNPLDDLRPTQQVRFDLEVGPRVVGVVPQPVEIVNGNRIQRRDQVWVFFNEDPLSNPNAGPISSSGGSPLPVVNPQFYKLIYTGDTVESTDYPTPFLPTNVEYNPALNRAVLTFALDLSELAPAVANGNAGTYRLRVGSGDALPLPPTPRVSSEALQDTFAQAQPLGVTFGAGTNSVLVTGGVIQADEAFVSNWPGATDAEGSRDERRDTAVVGRTDTNIGINVFPYNFASLYGTDPQLNAAENAITQAQKQRARQVLDLYSERLGVSFVETQNEGLQIVTGDLRTVVISADTGAGSDTPLSIYRVNDRDPTQGILVLDAGENWYDGYGVSPDSRPSWFVEAVRGIGSLLGIGNLFELPAGVGAGGSSPDEPNSVFYSEQFYPNLPLEPDFISQSDLTIGQALHRPESNDVDFYSFTAATPGRLAAETIAERLDGSSLLDTHLNLYLVDGGEFTLVARNDDFYSDDSFIGIDIEPGDYIIGVSASGNENYNGQVDGSGLGGTSEGRYELRMTFDGSTGATITDTTGTELDGDADGNEGGNFNFWFRVARDLSNAGTNNPRTIFVDKLGDDSDDGSLGSPLQTISAAFAIAQPGDLVRLLPNGGADGLITTARDNLAYEIGRGGNGNAPLRDGTEFEVPKGVTVMIDAGAILKLQTAKISVGSESVDEDRSLAALQVLGTPVLSESGGTVVGSGEVIFTSYDNQNVALTTNPLTTTPIPGNWAGIEFRNDFDYSEGRAVWETEGIFLDYVSHADMSYGGGSVAVNDPVVTPLQMAESRPTIIYSTITNSADAAMSADPNSFLETNFHSPNFQRVESFTSDYDRVGPEIAGNTLINNSINGLFVRVNTPAAGQLEPMTVSGRFDDTDIVHSLSESLVLQGQPGGPLLLEDRPDVLSLILTPGTAGSLTADTYDYRLTFVDQFGNESLASLPSVQTTVAANGSVAINNLPPAPLEFAGRRLYRLVPGTGNYEFVTQLDRGATSHVDDGTTRGGILRSEQRPVISGVTLSASTTPGTVFPGSAVKYRVTFVDAVGGETQASLATPTFITPANGSIQLSNLPAVPSEFAGRRIYRLDPASGDYLLVVEINADATSYLDDGSLLGGVLTNNGNNGALLLPRFNARLSVDPGTIVKLQNSRIQAQFGADFYAEGVDGKEVVFTSRLDDTFGAGGTFDTNNDGIADNAAPADWGGLIFRQDSTGSLDYASVRYGGGSTPAPGGFTDFNPIEILQADVRVTNSSIYDNASGFVATSNRGGFGFNDDAAIFVRGSQPIIVDNIIEGNAGVAISVNPNALDFHDQLDVGRSTGPVDKIVTDQDNQGPLIAGNRIDDNTINAMRVRSEVLTTESVWDDTDIVHYVDGQIVSATHHYHSGLRLKSDPEQSLVVKSGPGAELIGTGIPLDIEDRIGGTLQVLGTPGNPVILTSVNDCTVGAGFTPDGRPMNDTLGAGACVVEEIIEPPSVPYVDVVVVMDESGSMGSTQQFSAQFIQDLEAGLLAAGVGVVDGNRFGAVGFGRSGVGNEGRSLIVGGGLFGTAAEYAAATSQFVIAGAVEDGYAGIDYAIANYPFRADAAKFIILATDEPRSNVNRSLTLTSTIANLQANDIRVQGILGMTITDDAGNTAIAIDNTTVYTESGTTFATQPGGIVTRGSSVADYLPLVQATDGIAGDLSQIGRSTLTAQIFGQALISSIVTQAGGAGGSGNGAVGDWQGLTIDVFANDRNVAHVIETEDAIPATNASNAIANDAQRVGDLAAHEYAGDETERLGFTIRGTLADESDVDVYSFTATGGTTVFLDIDDTSFGFDSLLELIDVNDNVLARSDNSFAEATGATTLISNLPDEAVRPLFQLGTGNVEGPNPMDAGMRVVLPGSTNSENVYYVRVRSAAGITSGQYNLSIRLREADEVAGSTVQFADIRYATDAIRVTGAPLHSPLTADAQERLDYSVIIDPTPTNPQSGDEFVQETADNRLGFAPADVDALGNLLTTDRGSLLVTGEIGNINSIDADVRLEDVDVYQVDLFTQQIEPDVFDSENRFVTVTFDIDYADVLGRANTSLSVYNQFGQLILHSRDSNLADDVGRPLNGIDMENLAAGSAGVLDAHIGPVELREGRYFVAVSNAAVVPAALDQFFNPASPDPNLRLMPINSVRRIAEDTLDEYTIESYDASDPFLTSLFDDDFNYTAEGPTLEPVFDQNSIVPYTLDDMRLFVSLDTGISGTNQSTLASFNPFTGTMERLIGQSGQPTDDLALRSDGELFTYSLGPQTGNENNGNVGNLLNLSPIDSTVNSSNDDNIVFFSTNQAGTDLANDDNAQLDVHALTFPLTSGSTVRGGAIAANAPGYLIGSRDNRGRGFEIPSELTRNLFYEFDVGNGQVTSRGSDNGNTHRMFTGTIPYTTNQGPASDNREWGVVDTGFIFDTGGDGGDITGMAIDPGNGSRFFGVTDLGGVHSFNFRDNLPAPDTSVAFGYGSVIPTQYHGQITKDPLHAASTGAGFANFTGMAMGPRSIEGGAYLDTMFATTTDGWLYALEFNEAQEAVPANVFYNGRAAIPLIFQGDNLFFSGSSIGVVPHGLAFSHLEESPWRQSGDRGNETQHGIEIPDDQSRVGLLGSSSLHYNFDVGAPADNTIARGDTDARGELAPGGSHGSVISRPFNLEGYSSADKPTLYFTYLMEVEGDDDYRPGGPNQNDSFSVFGSGDDGQWLLLATNDNFRNLGASDEFDYFNESTIPVQELFDDTTEWRQARVDLGPLAGDENVRIRFDFSTSGSMRTQFGSVDFVGVPGDEVVDHQEITFVDENFNDVLYESIVGRDVVFPAGSALEVGDQFSVTGPDGDFTVTFVTATPTAVGEVQFTTAMTAIDVAEAVLAILPGSLNPSDNGDGSLSLFAASAVTVIGDIPVGQSNPVQIEVVERPFQFIPPSTFIP